MIIMHTMCMNVIPKYTATSGTRRPRPVFMIGRRVVTGSSTNGWAGTERMHACMVKIRRGR